MLRQSPEVVRSAARLGCVLSMAIACAGCAMTVNRTSPAVSQPTRAVAGVPPGSWDRVQQLPVGAVLSVGLKNGVELRGHFSAIGPSGLILVERSGKTLTIGPSEIARINLLDDDSLLNGASIGGGIGLAAAAIILAAAGSGDGYTLPSAKWGAPLLLSGAGVLTGALIDRGRKRHELIYITP